MIFADQFKNNPDTPINSRKMPVAFIGHGNPMNALENNQFTVGWIDFAKKIPAPSAILCISAHWLTKGTLVTAMKWPRTIHDFGGFPKVLYDQQYPAPGSPVLAERIVKSVFSPEIKPDIEWGLDHGTWSVLLQMFPAANIPVLQLSIDYGKPPQYHYDLAKQLAKLRSEGVLVIGSGNMVHNLGSLSPNSGPFDWALEFDQKITSYLELGDYQQIIGFQKMGNLANMAHPTIDHFIPLLYVIGLQQKTDKMEFFNVGFDMASISMRSVVYY
jgi:4,5-DOPA dioxygenase extradiol